MIFVTGNNWRLQAPTPRHGGDSPQNLIGAGGVITFDQRATQRNVTPAKHRLGCLPFIKARQKSSPTCRAELRLRECVCGGVGRGEGVGGGGLGGGGTMTF